MSILQILDRLATTSSTNEKLEFLKQHSNNTMLKNVFRLTYTPQIRFWIKKRPVVEPNTTLPYIALDYALLVLETDIASRSITGNSAIEKVQELLIQLDADDREVFYRVIERDLKCGTGTSIANKVWKNLILDYPVLLCNKFNAKTEKYVDWEKGQILQTKMDSSRINFEFDGGKLISISTRNGSIIDITAFQDIVIPNNDHIVLDGELMYSVDGKDLDRKTSSGIINKAIKGTISPEEAKNLNLVAWDLIPYEDFVKGICNIPYRFRFLCLQKTIGGFVDRIEIVESKIVYSKEEALQQYNENLVKGLEGCILKNPDAIWSNKRSNDYLKMKAELTADLVVIGYNMGTPGSQFEGLLGSLICETEDGKLQVNVGSGFKHLKGERDDPKSYIGKIIEVKYNEVIGNKNSDKKSLFLPIYNGIRFDKDTANTLEEL